MIQFQPLVSLSNPTGRNTRAAIVTVGAHEFFFSYATCIAYRGTLDGAFVCARIANSWGPTTGRHFRELGCAGFATVSDADFHALLAKIA